MKRIVALLLLAAGIAIPAFAQSQSSAAPGAAVPTTWMQAHHEYVKNYWHAAFAPSPAPGLRLSALDGTPMPSIPSDVYTLGKFGSSAWSYGVTNNYDVGACVERELHDGQWLAGGCKDILYLLHADAQGNVNKAAHLGGAVMSNAQHANTTYQIKAGIDLNTAGAAIYNGLTLAAPTLADLNVNLPPWASKLANAVTFDFSAGYRPVHDSSVNGNLTYGIMAMVNVPITTTFEWLIQGM